jgi:hypothetical protein
LAKPERYVKAMIHQHPDLIVAGYNQVAGKTVFSSFSHNRHPDV